MFSWLSSLAPLLSIFSSLTRWFDEWRMKRAAKVQAEAAYHKEEARVEKIAAETLADRPDGATLLDGMRRGEY